MDKYIAAHIEGTWYVLERDDGEYTRGETYKMMTQARDKGNAEKIVEALNEADRALKDDPYCW